MALAHELMKKVAHNIDQVKTKLDQARLVKELAGILDGWLGPDLSVLGDLLHEGRLLEHSKPRIVLLFQTMLIIAKPKEDKRLQFRAYIPVGSFNDESFPSPPLSLTHTLTSFRFFDYAVQEFNAGRASSGRAGLLPRDPVRRSQGGAPAYGAQSRGEAHLDAAD